VCVVDLTHFTTAVILELWNDQIPVISLCLQIVNFGPHAVNLTIRAHQLRAAVDARGSRVTVLTSSDVMHENSFRNPRNVRGWLLFISFFFPYCYHFYTSSESVNWNIACQSRSKKKNGMSMRIFFFWYLNCTTILWHLLWQCLED